MSGVIYMIVTGDECYVGSTRNFNERSKFHNDIIYATSKNYYSYNYKLYKRIRANGGEYEISIYDDNLSMTDIELRIYEEEVRVLLGATLNSQRAYVSSDTKKEEARKRTNEYYANNKKLCDDKNRSIVTCECGIKMRYDTLSKHRKTARHLRLMTLLA